MLDGKMADILLHIIANDPIRIEQGFHIEKLYEDVVSAWNSLESREIYYNDPRRAGQCHKPMTQ